MKPPTLFEIPHGTPPAACSGCGKEMYWVTNSKTGKSMPLVIHSEGLGGIVFGSSHFIDCPNAPQFRRKS